MGFEKEKKSVPRSERKAKKRKAEDAIPDVPEDYAEEEPVEEVKSSKKRKHTEDDESKPEKKSRKEKKAEKNDDAEMNEAENDDKDAQDGEEGPRLSKKERKALRKAKEAAEKAANPPVEGAPLETDTSKKEASDKKTDAESKPAPVAKPVRLDADGNPIKKKNNRNREKKRLAAAALAASGEKAPPRFIVFVGNLPYTATKEKIEQHFASVHPKSVRHLTDKATGKSRGTAFVEFEGYDHMKTALRTMHHTQFDDGSKEGRRINVELT